MKELQKRLIYIIVSGIVSAVLLVGIISIASYISTERDNVMDMLNSELEVNTDYLDIAFNNVEVQVDKLSEHYTTNFPGASNLEGSMRTGYLRECKDLAMMFTERNSYVASSFFRLNPEFGSSTAGFFLCTDSKGEIVDFPPTDISKYNPDDREHVGWWYEPIESGKAIWMDEYYNKNSDKRMISYVRPLYLSDGTLLGVAGIDIDMDIIYRELYSVKIHNTGFAALMSPDGEIHSSKNHPIELTKAEKAKIQKSSFVTELTYIKQQKRNTLLAKKMRNGYYYIISVENNDLYAKENRVVFTIIAVAILVSVIMILLLTAILHKLIYRFKNDSLTGFNGVNFYAEEILAIDESIRSRRAAEFSVIVFDLNGLKRTNDAFGHVKGDELLVAAADAIKEFFPEHNANRIGGDEFVIITHNNEAASLAYKLDGFRAEMTKRATNYDFSSGIAVVSAGMATYNPAVDNCYEDVFRKADREMYKDKAHFYELNPHLDRRNR